MNLKLEKDGTPFLERITYQDIYKEVKEIRAMIEQDFGPIDTSYSIIINFNSDNQIVTTIDDNVKVAKIYLPMYQIAPSNENERYQRRLNLSHECIHTITPMSDASKTTYLEEGVAVLFSEQYTNTDSSPPIEYKCARDGVKELLAIRKDVIKTIRGQHPLIKLSEITKEILRKNVPEMGEYLLEKLVTKFYTYI